MSRITGTVSRSVPLDSLLTRSLTLAGTFDEYVSEAELALLRPILGLLAASGILTAANTYQQSDSLLQGVAGVGSDSPVSTSGNIVLADLLVIPILIPDAATNTYTYKVPNRIEIIDVIVRKSGAGAANTITLQDSGAAAISDAIAAAVDTAVTRAGTLDPTKVVIAAGGTFKLLCTRAAGSMLANVDILAMKR